MTGRRRFMAVDQREEAQMSRTIYDSIMAQYTNRILGDWKMDSRMVNRVAGKILAVAGMNDLKWEVNVIESDEVNAFVLPGGKIFVFTGILKVARTEDAVAAVLGHEVAHQLARHSAEKLSMYKLAFWIQFLVSMVVDVSVVFNPVLISLGVALPFSRKCELEADYIGLMLMAKACYDPREADMKKVGGKQVAEFLSTHPSSESRVEKLREWLPDAMDKYHQSDCQSSQQAHFTAPFRQLAWTRW